MTLAIIELSAIHNEYSADVRPMLTFADMPHTPTWPVNTTTIPPPVDGPASKLPCRINGKLYDNADDKCGPLKPSTEASMFVKSCDTDVFDRKFEVDIHDDNSTALLPKRNAALEGKFPKLEPVMVMKIHPVVGTLDPWIDEMVGRDTDALKLLGRL